MAFDIVGARKSGVPDSVIADHLAKQRGFDIVGARKSGVPDSAVIDWMENNPQDSSTAIERNVAPIVNAVAKLGQSSIGLMDLGTKGLDVAADYLSDGKVRIPTVTEGIKRTTGFDINEQIQKSEEAKNALIGAKRRKQSENVSNAFGESLLSGVASLKDNPDYVLTALEEQIPNLLTMPLALRNSVAKIFTAAGGGAAGAAAVKAALPTIAKKSAVLEGAMTAGSAAGEKSSDGLSNTETASALGQGAATTIGSLVANKLGAKYLGSGDLESKLATKGLSDVIESGEGIVNRSIAAGREALKSGAENALEEGLQNPLEQIPKSIEDGDTFGQYLDKAGRQAAEGAVVGGLSGGAAAGWASLRSKVAPDNKPVSDGNNPNMDMADLAMQEEDLRNELPRVNPENNVEPEVDANNKNHMEQDVVDPVMADEDAKIIADAELRADADNARRKAELLKLAADAEEKIYAKKYADGFANEKEKRGYVDRLVLAKRLAMEAKNIADTLSQKTQNPTENADSNNVVAGNKTNDEPQNPHIILVDNEQEYGDEAGQFNTTESTSTAEPVKTGAREDADVGGSGVDILGGGETFNLESHTDEEIAQRESAAKEAADAEAQAVRDEENKEKADAEVGQFSLTGSDRPSDVAASDGQNDLFVAGRTSEATESSDSQQAESLKDNAVVGKTENDKIAGILKKSKVAGTKDIKKLKQKMLAKNAVDDAVSGEPDISNAQESNDIISTSKKKYIAGLIKKHNLKKGSPGYDTAIKKLESAYDESLDKALAALPFEQFHDWSVKDGSKSETMNRRAWEALREEYGIEDVASSKAETDTDTKKETAKQAQPSTESSSNNSPVTNKIEDFGEKLEGKRTYTPSFVSGKPTENDITTKPLSEIWPSNAHEKIEDKQEAALVFALRSEIPAKPRNSYKLSRWVEKIQEALSIAKGDFFAGVGGKVTADLIREKGTPRLHQFANRLETLYNIDREQWSRLGDVAIYPDSYSYDEQGNKVASQNGMFEVDGKRHRVNGVKTVADILPAIERALGEDKKKEKIAFQVRGTDNYAYIMKTGDKEYRRLKEFKTGKEALDYLKSNYDDVLSAWNAVKDRDNVSKADTRRDTNRPRTGADHRKGKDATPEMFEKAFGFRGVEFGNWVSQGANAKERQGMLNLVYDSLHDLAAILNIPTKAVSLNGTLGLSLGSRGSGNASAHFERDNLVINLTKTKGAGTLAHEWFHALDNYFSRMRREDKTPTKKREGDFITYKPEAYYQKGDQYIPVKDFEEAVAAGRDKYDYDKTYSEARRKHAATWRVIGKTADGWVKRDAVRPEVEQAFADLVEALNASPMAARSRLLDKNPKNDYWSRIIERGARSFENYVISKMRSQGYDNDYLANVVPVEDFVRNQDRYPYLMPSEEAPVVEAFDNLFDTIQTKEGDDGNVALFSRNAEKNGDISDQVADDIITLYKELGSDESVFQYDKSVMNTIDETVFSVLPDGSKQEADDLTLEMAKEEAKDRGQPEVVDVRKYVIPTVETVTGRDNKPILDRDGNPQMQNMKRGAYVYTNVLGEMWVDLSELKKAGGIGGKIYSKVADFAHENGLVFIGDPLGLSDDALIKRTEHMASGIARRKRTSQFAPHPRQVSPYVKDPKDSSELTRSVRPLKWVKGGDRFNQREIIKTAYHNITKIMPELRHAWIDINDGRIYQAGSPIDTPFENWVRDLQEGKFSKDGQRREDSAGGLAGQRAPLDTFRHLFASASIKRQLLANTLAQYAGESEGKRRQVLDRLGAILPDLENLDDRKVFYQRSSDNGYKRGLSDGKEQTFASGLPRNLPVAETTASRTLESKLNGWRERQGLSGRVRIREISPVSLPKQLNRALARFTDATGTRVVLFRNLTPEVDDFNGVNFRDGVLYINENSLSPITLTAAHEWVHTLKKTNPSAYQELENEVRRQGRLDAWHERNITEEGFDRGRDHAIEELTAAAVSDALTDPVFLQKLAERDQSAFRRIAKDFLKFLKTLIDGWKDQGSNAYLQDVEAFRDKLVQVLDELPVAKQSPGVIKALFLRVWHGTPYRGIEKTGFKLNKIGTGEGAQAYGWGMYFAGAREVAEYYRRSLSGAVTADAGVPHIERRAVEMARAFAEDDPRSWLLKHADTGTAHTTPAIPPETFRNAINELDAGRIRIDSGQLYKVDIPEDDTYLLWDKPLSEQPKAVKDALGNQMAIKISNSATGADIYSRMAAHFGGAATDGAKERASKRLHQLGINGIKYLDGSSRGAGDGNYNYVIWNEDLLTPEAAKIEPMYSREQSTKAPHEKQRASGKLDNVKEAIVRAKLAAKTKATLNKWVKKERGLTESDYAAYREGQGELHTINGILVPRLTSKMKKAWKAEYGTDNIMQDVRKAYELKKYLDGDKNATLPDSIKSVADMMRAEIDLKSAQIVDIISDDIRHLASVMDVDALDAANSFLNLSKSVSNSSMSREDSSKVLSEAVKKAINRVDDAVQKSFVSDFIAKSQQVDSILANKGKYMNRSYQAHNDPDWMSKIIDDRYSNAGDDYKKNIVNHKVYDLAAKDILKGNPQATDKEIYTAIRQILQDASDVSNPMAAFGSSALIKKMGIFKGRKLDDMAGIRNLLGEYNNPVFAFANTMAKQTNIIASHKFLKGVRDNGLESGLFSTKQEGNYQREITGNGMSPLSGLYTTEKYYNTINDVLHKDKPESYISALLHVSALIKAGKTVLSPGTSILNFLSNASNAMSLGHWSPKAVAKTAKFFVDYSRGDKDAEALMDEAGRLGVISGSLFSHEVAKYIKEHHDVLANEKENIKRFMKPARMYVDAMTWFYEFGDNAWKINAYFNEIENGVGKTKAADIVANGYPNYSTVPKTVDMLKTVPFISDFPSFVWEQYRVSAHQLKWIADEYKDGNKAKALSAATRFIIARGLLPAAAYAISLANGWDYDEGEEYQQRMMAPWDKNGAFIFMPKDGKGNVSAFNIGRYSMYDTQVKVIKAIVAGEPVQAVKEALSGLASFEMWVDALYSVAKGRTSSGALIYSDSDTAGDKVKKGSEFLWTQLAPTVLSKNARDFTQSNADLINHTLEGTPLASMGVSGNAKGKNYSNKASALQLIGVRNQNMNASSSLKNKIIQNSITLRANQKTVRDLLGSQSYINNAQVADVVLDYLKQYDRANNRISEDARYLISSGVAEKNVVFEALKSANVSKENAARIVTGSPVRWKPSKDMVEYIKDQIFNSDLPADKKREYLSQRIKVMNQTINNHYAGKSK